MTQNNSNSSNQTSSDQGLRIDGRNPTALRPISILTDFVDQPLGSALISWGNTKVLCTASVVERVPPWLMDSGKGWVTAEYSLLPGSTHTRSDREAAKGKMGGRTLEIQRLIARSLRGVINLKKLGQRQIFVDCDVLQADGGTRCASITGGYVALAIAIQRLMQKKLIKSNPIKDSVAAVSLGLVKGAPLLDLNYPEDSSADVDLNVVMCPGEQLIEVQGTGEKTSFSRKELNTLLDMAFVAGEEIFELQNQAIKKALA